MGDYERKNLIVLGAGASKEFNLPTGLELKKQIAGILDLRFSDWGTIENGDINLIDAFRNLSRQPESKSHELDRYVHAAREISKNMPLAPSIDNFLDTRKDDEVIIEVGKIAITKAILEAEASCLLVPKRQDGHIELAHDSLNHAWISQFFQILVAQRDFSGFLDAVRGITFVSFNYDRCIHQYFAYAAKSYFGLNEYQVVEVIEALEILYPYGNVGDFSWSQGSTNFGAKANGHSLMEIAGDLRTFTEGTGSETINTIKERIGTADIIMFLGFGFLRLNMELLIGNEEYDQKIVLATAKGLSENSRVQLMRELTATFPNRNFSRGVTVESNVRLLDRTCADLIFEFHRYLSA